MVRARDPADYEILLYECLPVPYASAPHGPLASAAMVTRQPVSQKLMLGVSECVSVRPVHQFINCTSGVTAEYTA